MPERGIRYPNEDENEDSPFPGPDDSTPSTSMTTGRTRTAALDKIVLEGILVSSGTLSVTIVDNTKGARVSGTLECLMVLVSMVHGRFQLLRRRAS
ncbi:hypothetical protein BDZ89DRAFT_1059449 [Hymenopellis radicata]|nr:hypothetical protein BDZ89DRAFT_1059449 [Hymenopellis radicata]